MCVGAIAMQASSQAPKAGAVGSGLQPGTTTPVGSGLQPGTTTPVGSGLQPGTTQAKPAVKGPRAEDFLGKFPPLGFKPPKAADFRTTLSNGLVVYLAEDHEIPWFEATLLTPVAGGGMAGGRGRGMGEDEEVFVPQRPGGGGGGGSRSFLEPKDKLGIQNLCGSVMRSGGTTTMTADQINERMDLLAGSVSPTSLSIHMRHLDEGLKIWLDMLTNPAFPEDRIAREKVAMAAPLRNRNRNLTGVASTTWEKLIYGEDSPITAEMTEATINGITRDDVIAWHKKYRGEQRDPGRRRRFQQGRHAADARGDVRQVAQRRDEGGAELPAGRRDGEAGRLHGAAGRCDAEPGRRPRRDAVAHTGRSRLPGRGSDELHAGRRVVFVAHHADRPQRQRPGLQRQFERRRGRALSGAFNAFTQTKNSTVVFATQLMVNEVERMWRRHHAEGPGFRQDGARQLVPVDVLDRVREHPELRATGVDGRPMNYYETYLAKYEKVTLADVRRVAKRYLQPDKMVILITGTSTSAAPARTSCCPTRARSTRWQRSTAAAPSTAWRRSSATARCTLCRSPSA